MARCKEDRARERGSDITCRKKAPKDRKGKKKRAKERESGWRGITEKEQD